MPPAPPRHPCLPDPPWQSADLATLPHHAQAQGAPSAKAHRQRVAGQPQGIHHACALCPIEFSHPPCTLQRGVVLPGLACAPPHQALLTPLVVRASVRRADPRQGRPDHDGRAADRRDHPARPRCARAPGACLAHASAPTREDRMKPCRGAHLVASCPSPPCARAPPRACRVCAAPRDGAGRHQVRAAAENPPIRRAAVVSGPEARMRQLTRLASALSLPAAGDGFARVSDMYMQGTRVIRCSRGAARVSGLRAASLTRTARIVRAAMLVAGTIGSRRGPLVTPVRVGGSVPVCQTVWGA